MKLKIFLLFFGLFWGLSHAQETKSRADKYFYSYAYADAILEYRKEMTQGTLTNEQRLNLADAYFKTKDYANASKIYLEVNKSDSTISNHRFNKMLQSLAQTAEKDRVKSLLKSRRGSLHDELFENAEFNFELLETSANSSEDFQVFNIKGNSAQADFSPTFYKDELLFSSGRTQKSKDVYAPSGESYLDIYRGKVESNGDVVNINEFTGIPDSKYHEATPYFSKKLNQIFYIASNEERGKLLFDEKGKNALAIVIVKNGAGADQPFNYLLRDLSVSFYYPYYDEASDRLYFSANFDEGYGGTDLYYVSTFNGQIMSQPVNMGPRINSAANEIAPFIFDGSLYFSSDVFYGLGGMDIYKANQRPDNTFSIPVNLGRGINSDADDFGFIIKESGLNEFSGFFSSNRSGGKGNDDIYGFKVAEKPGLKTFAIKGTVLKPRSSQGIAEASVKVLDAEGKTIKEVLTQANGSYQLEIPWRETVFLEISKKKHSVFSQKYVGADQEEVQKKPLVIEMAYLEDVVEPKEDKMVLKLQKIKFAKAKSNLTPETLVELDKVADLLLKFPGMRVKIESHTDSRGSSYSNKRISQQRSEALYSYLMKKGVPSENIIGVLGYGEEQITNSCTNGAFCLDFLHDQNVRSLFVVDNYDELINQ
ncbi:OmpA family protein [uncultured Kriegella sp.]|uniref:OmpA family protein n=1 Tax=uncultured Kriegella sp. TaxID=1798910 RepID=UPI0030DD7D53|tara:strand:- start:19067 stop:21016 length:1950 start_codon:yes stop_codon:yes gene_type:complete